MSNNFEKNLSEFDFVNIDRIDAFLGDVATLDEDEWVFDDIAQLKKIQNVAKIALVALSMVATGEFCAEEVKRMLLPIEEMMRKKE